MTKLTIFNVELPKKQSLSVPWLNHQIRLNG